MSQTNEKNVIAFVMQLPKSSVDAVRAYEKTSGQEFDILLITDSRAPKTAVSSLCDIHVQCDFSKPSKLTAALLPYQKRMKAITCRGEVNISRFQQLIPHVPYLRTPSTESLMWAADKYEMRKRLKAYDSKLTPAFTLVKKNSKVERERVIAKIGFPMVIKPTNLVESRFVSICYHEEELERTLRNLFVRLRNVYKKEGRQEEPKVIAEGFMEGDMYSIDSYTNVRGKVVHCPLVRTKTGREKGHPDAFSSYLQLTPTVLKSASIQNAETVAEKAIHALGLRSTTTHVELMKVDDEWKVIEIGARMGGFRHLLHKLSCDIDHAQNDIFIRLPKKPVVPKKCKGYACAIKWYASKEGVITELKGIKKIVELESFSLMNQNKKIGDRFVFAKNGGKSVFNLFMYNADRSKLLADIRRVEQLVEIKVASRGAAKKAKSSKKVTKPVKVTKSKQLTKKKNNH